MPARHTIKQYHAEQYYHVFNRGVEKRKIFKTDCDYRVFLSYIKTYLQPKNEDYLRNIIDDPMGSYEEKNEARRLLRLNNFYGRIELHGYCLMPNHFHLLLFQKDNSAIDNFMNSLCTRYTMYFNSHYNRVGPLLQNVYKAVSVNTEEQLITLLRYIYRNPLGLFRQNNHRVIWHYHYYDNKNIALQEYPYSSYGCSLGKKQIDWVNTVKIPSLFSDKKVLSFQTYVESGDNEVNFETDAFTIEN